MFLHKFAYLVGLVTLSGLLSIITFGDQLHFTSLVDQEAALSREAAGNATLGFQKILALSFDDHSWRAKGLRAAANQTGLDVMIPFQPHNTPKFVTAFASQPPSQDSRDYGELPPARGSATAWLGHLDLLKYVIQSRYETALILEDDADWDVRVKEQMQRVFEGLRTHFVMRHIDDAEGDAGSLRRRRSSPGDELDDFAKSTSASDPYHSDEWDVLWLGHCGKFGSPDLPGTAWPDTTTMPLDRYILPIREKFNNNYWPKDHRLVQDTRDTLCSFGYAVTAKGAAKVLDVMSAGKGEAFDIMLSKRCEDSGLRCLTVVPELFHHHEVVLGTGRNAKSVSSLAIALDQGGAGDEASDSDEENGMPLGYTTNIVESARCAALYDRRCNSLEQVDGGSLKANGTG